jgi:flagellar biosynthesis/type III secretory pathway M-ring protein FliF/YscJ
MEKEDRPDGLETSLSDTDPEKSRERRSEQTLKPAHAAMARKDKENLVAVLKDWLHEGKAPRGRS